ncbi:MAG: ABC-F family ATP-binding cassette domain-containing protein [Pseudomonadota bacterium]
MLQVNNLSKSFGAQELFDNLTFSVSSGEKIGLVGRNGSGKYTLFRLILKEMAPDSGEIKTPKGYRIGALEQHIHFTQNTVMEECAQVLEELPEEEKYNHFQVEKILFGLGFNDEDMLRSPQDFSGGQQLRINLAKVLLKNCHLLLLDEPSNYLDIVSLRWLKKFLIQFPGEFIIITHDRHFMDDVTTHTMGLSRQKLRKIEGGTVKYYQQLAMEEEIYEQTRQNLDKKRKEMEEFVERFKAKASKAAQAQSRMKMLDKMGTMDALARERNLDFTFGHKECPGKVIMEAENLSFSYADGPLLFKNLSFVVGRQDRLGIIGKNGKGKSTLLNVLAGELHSLEGRVRYHPSAQLGHFGQTNILRLSLNATPIEEITSANPGLNIGQVRTICGTMMFSGDSAEKKIKVLSGGERSRVLLGKILARPTNLLLLDEPTNHLDMESVEALTEELKNYPGAVLLVTHSEFILRALATKIVYFKDGQAHFLDGDYDYFLEKVGHEDENEAKKEVKKKIERVDRQKRAEGIRERSKVLTPLKNEMESLEGQIVLQEEKLNRLHQNLELKTQEGQIQEITQISRSIGEAQAEIDRLFERLALATTEYENAAKLFED